jgi:hypothetical protein
VLKCPFSLFEPSLGDHRHAERQVGDAVLQVPVRLVEARRPQLGDAEVDQG